jgi:ribulose 1,5-bisphosphate synthetase/thiazole synthase
MLQRHLQHLAFTLGIERAKIAKMDVIVVGAGPAGVVAALRVADLGAKTALIIPLRNG